MSTSRKAQPGWRRPLENLSLVDVDGWRSTFISQSGRHRPWKPQSGPDWLWPLSFSWSTSGWHFHHALKKNSWVFIFIYFFQFWHFQKMYLTWNKVTMQKEWQIVFHVKLSITFGVSISKNLFHLSLEKILPIIVHEPSLKNINILFYILPKSQYSFFLRPISFLFLEQSFKNDCSTLLFILLQCFPTYLTLRKLLHF